MRVEHAKSAVDRVLADAVGVANFMPVLPDERAPPPTPPRAPLLGEPAGARSWMIRFSAEVQRLDRSGMVWLSVPELSKPIGPFNLDDDQFRLVDNDPVRWSRVECVARATQADLGAITDVLELRPPPDGDTQPQMWPVGEPSVALAVLREKIESFADLPRQWDSYSANAIAPAAIRAAIQFLDLAEQEALQSGYAMTAPFAAPVPTGAVQLEWHIDDRTLELEFEGRAITSLRCIDDKIAEGRCSAAEGRDLVAGVHGLGTARKNKRPPGAG